MIHQVDHDCPRNNNQPALYLQAAIELNDTEWSIKPFRTYTNSGSVCFSLGNAFAGPNVLTDRVKQAK